MRIARLRIARDRRAQDLLRLSAMDERIRIEYLRAHARVIGAGADLRGQILRIAREGLPEQRKRFLIALMVDRRECGPSTVGERVRVEILRQPRTFDRQDLELHLAGETPDDLVLNAAPVGVVAFDASGPGRE